MNKNCEITIMQCSNGFIVMPERKPSEYAATSEYIVCQTMAELLTFISEHYSHRQAHVFVDQTT